MTTRSFETGVRTSLRPSSRHNATRNIENAAVTSFCLDVNANRAPKVEIDSFLGVFVRCGVLNSRRVVFAKSTFSFHFASKAVDTVSSLDLINVK